MDELLRVLAALADRWLGSALSQVMLLFLALLLGLLVVAGLWERRLKSLGAAAGLAAALLLALLALGDSLAVLVGALDTALRLRLLALLLGCCLLVPAVLVLPRCPAGRRPALMWGSSGLLLLLSALFPAAFARFPSLLGLGFGAVILAVVLALLLLSILHLTVLTLDQQGRQRELAQRLSRLEERAGIVPPPPDEPPPAGAGRGWRLLLHHLLHPAESVSPRRWRGTAAAVPAIIALAVSVVTTVGLMAPQVMIGDEVTHYYMLEAQSRILPEPNFMAEIPTGQGGVEERCYPHSFLWHYLGALVQRATGGSFAAVQLYQALFLAQFLAAAYLYARSRGGVSTRSAMLYLLVLASLPMSLIFSVAFYQDVPMAAQVLTAFYLLERRRWIWATLFMALALWIKVNALLFYPVYLALLLLLLLREGGWRKGLASALAAVLLLFLSTWSLGWCIDHYSGAPFYPIDQLRRIYRKVVPPPPSPAARPAPAVAPAPAESAPGLSDPSAQGAGAEPPAQSLPPAEPSARQSEQVAEIIANHPGDLRLPVNFIVYGGVVLWLVVAAGLAQMIVRRRWPGTRLDAGAMARQNWRWPLLIGGSYSLVAAWMLRTAPDARFFLPAIPFLLLPFCERAVRLPRIKPLLAVVASLAILQGGYVLHKSYRLRQVSPGLREVIAHLASQPPTPRHIFMYPEGNYRLFPVPHEWYLGYRLREFWHAGNDERLRMLARHRVGAVVVKKHLVAPVDDAITDLGVYPDYFVRQIDKDPRFHKVFDNEAATVYRLQP